MPELTSYMGKMAPKMSKKAMLEILEKNKKTGGTVAGSGEARRTKGKSVIHIEDQFDLVECGFVMRKRSLEGADGDEDAISKRRVENMDAAIPPPATLPGNVFEQLLANQVSFNLEIVSLWNSPFLQSLTPSVNYGCQALSLFVPLSNCQDD